jgi:hypothetical protein
MDDTKKWWQSRLVWYGIFIALINAYAGIDATFADQLPNIPEWVIALVNTVLGGAAIQARLTTNTRIG